MKKTLLAILIALLSLLFATAVGLGVIHITGQPYAADLTRLHILEDTDFSRAEIMENYNAVMDFLSPFSNEPFSLPTMKYSQSGAGHFEDCKPIFNAVYLLGLLSFIALVVLSLRRLPDRRLLRLSGVITLAIPCIFGIGAYFNFDKLFVLFHKLFFSNDDWLFDPVTDEIITVLPERFFERQTVNGKKSF